MLLLCWCFKTFKKFVLKMKLVLATAIFVLFARVNAQDSPPSAGDWIFGNLSGVVINRELNV